MFRIVGNDNGDGLRIDGSVLFNGDTPVLGVDILERPLYGTEIFNAKEEFEIKDGRTVDPQGRLLVYGSPISDVAVGVEEMNNYMKNYKIEKTLYSSSKITVDILEDQIVIDLIEPDQYTSSIDLKRIEKKMIQPGLSALVTLSVMYAKGEVVYAKDHTFEAFLYEPDLKRKDFISDFGDFAIEYVEGLLRAVPMTKEVTECVISNCVVTYGCQESSADRN